MTIPTPLEDRLAGALTARAELVRPETLAPGTAPDVATVTPLRRPPEKSHSSLPSRPRPSSRPSW